MNLAVTNMFIKNAQFIGIMKSSIIKDFYDVKLKIEFYKILTTDRQLVEMVEKSCLEDHVNPNALNLVTNELVYSKVMNYNDSEYFRNYLSFVCSRDLYEDRKLNKAWLIEFKFPTSNDVHFFKIVLTTDQVTRLYSQVNSFYSNFMMFSAIAKHYSVEPPKKEDKKITEYAKSVNDTVTEIESQKVSQLAPVTKERTELDDIFELCLNSSIKSSLIHYTFNYFKYFTEDHCRILTNQKNQVQYILPLLIPDSSYGLNFDESYFNSLIQTNTSIPTNNIIFVIKKILNNLLLNHNKYREKPIIMMMLGYLLFIHMLKYLSITNPDSFRIHFYRLTHDADMQSRMLRSLITTSMFRDYADKIFFKIINVCPNNAANDQEIKKINELSQEYKHLIPISQEEFIEKVLTNTAATDTNLPNFFKLSNKKIIDISKYIKQTNQPTPSSAVLFDSDQSIDLNSIDKIYNILDYENLPNTNSRVISKAYHCLLNYVNDPSSVLLIKETDLPKEVVNLFNILSKKILNPTTISKDNVNTLDYYNILIETLPNPNKFNHMTLMYIIFQIMIPYHYDIYNTTQFVDCLL